ncbi:glycerophosphodiester phosphodiesterase family protein [Streptomyces sp. NPDC005483]|uniref:glycerophosphodiester phosphodiesterase family protein n=1 Tax=Streptomyces sp. NPDC005483 TaxID=3154882 RepID=UPI0033AF6851
MATVDKAARIGGVRVENDVRRTREDELVVLHDDSVRRTTDVEHLKLLGNEGCPA